MTNAQSAIKARESLVSRLAQTLNVDADLLQQAIKKNCFGETDVSQAEFFLLLLTAERLGLNPLLGEIWAFKGKSGKIQPLVSVDGWKSIMLRQTDFDGYEITFSDKLITLPGSNATGPEWCECTIYLKGRSHPTRERVYMVEKYVSSSTVWKNSPRLMLRHRAMIQAIRFSFANTSGIGDENDAIYMESLEAGKPAEMAAVEGNTAPAISFEDLSAQVSRIASYAYSTNQWQKASAAIRERVPAGQVNEALKLLVEERKRLTAQAEKPKTQDVEGNVPASAETVPQAAQTETPVSRGEAENDFDRSSMMF